MLSLHMESDTPNFVKRDNPITQPSDDDRQDLLAEQVKLVFNHARPGMIGTYLCSVGFISVFWSSSPRWTISLWFAGYTIVALLRYLQVILYLRAEPQTVDVKKWRNWFIAGTGASGIFWGTAASILFPDDIGLQVFLAFLIGGIAAGVVATYSAIKFAPHAYLVPAILPISVSLLMTDGAIGFTMGILCIAFLLAMTFTVFSMHKTTETSLRLFFENKALVKSLKIAKERFRYLSEGSLEGILVHDKGIVLDANRAIAEMFGYDLTEVKSLNALDFVEPGSRDFVMEKILSGDERPYEVVGIKRDGTKIPMEVHGKSSSYMGKEVRVVAIRDLTERKRVEERLRTLSNAIEYAGEMVIITNSDGIIEYVNPVVRRTGYTKGEIIGETPRIFKSGMCSIEFYKEMWDTIKAGNVWRGQLVNKKKSGELYDEEMTISPVLDEQGNVTHFVAIKRDISGRKRAEEALATAKNKVEEATRLKDKFVTLVSHDLRSPLGNIAGMLRLIGDQDARESDKTRTDEIISRVSQTCDGLITLIDQLLDISRLQSGNIVLRKSFIHTHALVSDYIERIEYSAEQKRITIVNDLPKDMRLFVDQEYFGEVVFNIIINAIKFSSEGDLITIFAPSDRPATIAVKDTGTGIEENRIHDLFKAEVKTSTLGTAGEKGFGFGLPYCQDIMAAHGGSIGVESTLGKGSVFYATLPDVKTVIMLVDDQMAHRNMMKEQLQNIGHIGFLEAENGREALKLLSVTRPDLLITDIEMPEMDGLELLETIQGNQAFKSIPVIVATSSISSEGRKTVIREKVLSLGARCLISKPIDPDEFTLTVRDLV